jgi:hypothetical protein
MNMSDRQLPENFGAKLLRQDEFLHSERYQEHRMQLEQSLTQAESRERLTKRVLVGAIVLVAVVFPILASHVFGSPVPFDTDATVLSICAGAIYTIAMAVFFVGVAANYWNLPRLRRTRTGLQEETIRELRRELAELRQLVEGDSKARKTDHSDPE